MREGRKEGRRGGMWLGRERPRGGRLENGGEGGLRRERV